MFGIGYFVPRAISDGPKIYPVPRFIAPHCKYNSVINVGNIAARICCNALLVNVICCGVAGGANWAPWDFIWDINSLQFIINIRCYSMPRDDAICAAIWLSRSSVALPPSPPPAVCSGI